MKNITQNLNNVKTVALEPPLETKLMQLDGLTREMVKILITLNPSQKEAVMQDLIRASNLNTAIDRLREKQTAQ